MPLSAELHPSKSRRRLAARILCLTGTALAVVAIGSAVAGVIVTGLDEARSDLAANSAQALCATVIVMMTAVLVASALNRIQRDWAQRWCRPCLLGTGILSIVVIVSVHQYLHSISAGTGTVVAFYAGILAPACLVCSVVVRQSDAPTTTLPERTQRRVVIVAIAVGASVTALTLTGFALAQGVPEQIRLADDSALLGPIRLGFGVAVGVAVAVAAIVLVTRTSDETLKIVTVLLVGVGGVTLGWLVMFRVPDDLQTAYDLALVPGVRGSSSITMIGVFAAAAAGLASIGLVAEQFTGSGRADRSITVRTTAVVLVACVAAGSIAATGLYVHQGGPTRTSPAAEASPRAYPTVPGPVDYRIDLHDNPARSVVPTGNGFAFFDRHSLVAYDGVTGTPRWRMKLDILDRVIPGRRAFQGLDSHRFLIANGSGASSTLTMVGDNDRIVTVDGITGRVLWSTTDDVYLLDSSRRATSRDALVGIRTLDDRTEVVSIDPRSGRTLWARPTSSKCSPRGDIIGTTVALTDLCDLRDAVAVVDTRTGAARPTTRVGHSGSISAEGDLIAVGPSSEVRDDATTTLIDPTSGAVVETLVGDGLRSPVRGGHYLTASRSGQLEIRRISSPRRIAVSAEFGPVTGRSPAVWTGDELYVTTPVNSMYGPGLMQTGPGVPNTMGHISLTCPPQSELSSVLNVPGAQLVLCAGENRRGAYAIVGSGDSKS